MSNGAYAGLRLAARAGKPESTDTPPEAAEAEGNQENSHMTDTTKEHEDAIAKAAADATQAANARFGAVLASEHYAGREILAHTLLGTGLSADEIIGSLAAAEKKAADPVPQASGEEQAAAAERGGRAVMQDALAQTRNSDVEAGGGAPDKAEAASKMWDRVYDKRFGKTA